MVMCLGEGEIVVVILINWLKFMWFMFNGYVCCLKELEGCVMYLLVNVLLLIVVGLMVGGWDGVFVVNLFGFL